MVKRVLLFASLAALIFAACNDEMGVMENGNLKSGDAQILSLDSIPGDTIVPRDTVIVPYDTIIPPIEDPGHWIDSITPPPLNPDSIYKPEYPVDTVIPNPPVIDPEHPVDSITPIPEPWIPPVNPPIGPDSLKGGKRINTFK